MPLYGLALLIALSPFQAFLRITFPESTVILFWRDVLAYGLVLVAVAFAVVQDHGVPRHWINGVLLLYIAWGLLMIPLSANIAVGLYGFRAVVRYAPLYFAALLVIRSEGDVRLLSKSMLVGAIVLALLGIYQWFAPVAPLFRMFEDIGIPNQRFGQRPLFGVYFPRIDSLYMGGVVGFAIYVTSCIGVVLYALRSGSKGRQRLFYWLIAASLIFVILFSASRSAWVGFSLILFVILSRRRRRLSRWLILPMVAAPLLYLTFFPEPSAPSFIREALDRSLYQLRAFPTDPVALLFGQGYAFSGYAEGVPEIFQARVLVSGALDSQWLFAVLQFGLIGALLHGITLVGFITVAYRMHRRYLRHDNLVQPKGLIWHPTPLLGTFLLLTLSSFYSAPLYTHGLDANFYVLGAIAVWYSHQGRVSGSAGVRQTTGALYRRAS